MIYPMTGSVFEAAKIERNWLVWHEVPNPDPTKKPRKVPLLNGRADSPDAAACLTFEEAGALIEVGRDLKLGYLPRDGSALVAVDMDDIMANDEVLPDFDHWLTDETYTEVSPSGTGVRMICARTDDWPSVAVEDKASHAGLLSSAGRYFSVTGDAFEGVMEATPAPLLRGKVLLALHDRIEAQLNSERASREAQAEATGGQGWWDALTDEERVMAAQEMLSALPNEYRIGRDLWRDVTFALRPYSECFGVWDEWCRGGENYDGAQNTALWDGRDRGGIGIGTLIHLAQAEGADLRIWKSTGQRRRAGDRIARFAQRIEAAMPGASEANEAMAEEAQGVADAVEAQRDEAADNLVAYQPSISARDARWMVLDRQATLSGSVADMWTHAGVNNYYGMRDLAQGLLGNAMRTDRMPVVDPRLPFGFTPDEDGSGLGVVNKYRHREVLSAALEASRDPRHPALLAWAELMDRVFIVGRERVWAEQWLAFKARFPWERMVALVNATKQTGTGRGMLTNKVREMFGEVNTAAITISNFVGEGARFNQYLASTMAIMDELSAETAALGRQNPASIGKAIYEKLKECVDPQPKWVEINAKYGKLGWQWSFTSFLLCTNHENALPIPELDRRFCVTTGNPERMPDDVYQRLKAALEADGAVDVIWAHLTHGVDIEGFNPAWALETDAKRAMIDSNISDLDFEIATEMQALGWPVYMTMDLLRGIALLTDEGKARAHDKSLEPALKNWLMTHTTALPAATAGDGARVVKVKGKPARVRVCQTSLKARGMSQKGAEAVTGSEAAEALAATDIAVIRRRNGQSPLHVVKDEG